MIIDTEKAIIACLIKDNTISGEILNNIQEDDFTDIELKKLFSVCSRQYKEHGEIDIFNLVKSFDKDLLTELSTELTTTADYTKYIKKMKNDSFRNIMIAKLAGYQERLKLIDDVNDLYSEFLKDLTNVDVSLKKQNKKTIEYIPDYLDYIAKNKKRGMISTGFDNLDYQLNGGVYSGLYVVGAISTLGKTSFMLQIADNMANNGNDVLFFSLEMNRYELMSRSISRILFENDSQKFKDYGVKEIINGEIYNCKNELNTALKQYENIAKNMIIFQCNFGMTIEQINSEVRNYIVRTGKKPIVFIDYLQIIQASSVNATKKDGIDHIIVGLKKISSDNDIPVFTVSSFGRGSYYHRCTMASFKESGGIEYTADVVIGLQFGILDDSKNTINDDTLEKEKEQDPRKITALILKNRRGKAYSKQCFNFYPKNNLFEEV